VTVRANKTRRDVDALFNPKAGFIPLLKSGGGALVNQRQFFPEGQLIAEMDSTIVGCASLC
jgi:hypothetical protein